jgi:hypothetical protein
MVRYRFSSGGLCRARPFSPPWRSSQSTRVALSAAPSAILASPQRPAEPCSVCTLSLLATFCPCGLRGGLRRVSVLDLLPHWPAHSVRACQSPADIPRSGDPGVERPKKPLCKGGPTGKPVCCVLGFFALSICLFIYYSRRGFDRGSPTRRTTPRCRFVGVGPGQASPNIGCHRA